ncbi:hypothetical protein [Empedobacter tilapiae]|uniref:DUF8202 domain-containing protein n=1 Tax=Empedobacter tilapiae TaxID=2491114 RepID=A0A4Z1B2Z9_9FLAO|nr:hypothetical protein [Empedobacter tilapiae]TGN27873.1 hypothetical protein E4J94_06580 [Empedobacter tilapiae]
MKKIFNLLAISLLGISSFAQTKPGNTTLDVEVWLKADDITVADKANISTWTDNSGKGRNYVQNGSNAVPLFDKQNLMNFQPSLSFPASPTNRKLILNTPFITNTKSYFVFYVSKVINNTSRSVTYSIDGDLDGSVGWRYQDPFVYSTATSNTNTMRRMYGINTAIFKNKTGTTNRNLIYHNGVPSTLLNGTAVEGTANVFAGSDLTRASVIGNSNITTAYPFVGNIQEIIVLSSNVTGDMIHPDELRKVSSYLALKYGISLDKEAQKNYVNSDNTVVWNGTEDVTYNNHRFGIGRDNASGLYQKQSTSFDKSFATVFLGDLAITNNENTDTSLNSGDYLIFGSNGMTGGTVYEYSEGTSFPLGGTFTKDVNRRTRTILKAQATKAFTVNIRPEVRATHVLVSNDATFSQVNTKIYPLDANNIAKNVAINNGNYISYAYFLTAPGGVTDGMRVWLNADETNLDLVNGNEVNVWNDLSLYGNDYSYAALAGSGRLRPTYISCDPLMNFNPSVNFGINDYLAIANGPMSTDAPNAFTSFTVYSATAYADRDRLYTHGFGGTNPTTSATRYPAMGFAPDDQVGRLRNDGTGQTNNDGNAKGFKINTTALQMISTKKANGVSGAGYTIHDFGGWQDHVNATGNFGDGFRMAQGGTIGGASLSNASFQGRMSEVFFYERELTLVEQNAIRSYLGMKYAITLDADGASTTVNYDYILSDNLTKVWAGNSVPNNKYHNNVAGLVRDDVQNLNIRRAKSTAKGASITLLTKGTETCGVNGEEFDNRNGIFVGHNNGSVDYKEKAAAESSCGSIEHSLTMTNGGEGRIWLAQNSSEGNVIPTSKSITIRAGGEIFPFDGASFEVYLMISNNEADLKNSNWENIQTVPMTYVDGEHEVNYIFTKEYTYFTFGAKSVMGDCDRCEFGGIKTLDFPRNNWDRGQKERTFDLDDNFFVDVKVEDYNLMSRNYPRPYVQKTLRERRKGTDNVTTTFNFYNNVVTEGPNDTEIIEKSPISSTVNFQLYHVDRQHYNYKQLQVVGYCDGARVYPKMTYIEERRPERSKYNIIGQGKAYAKKRGERYSGSTGYTNKYGRVFVEFESPVSKIEIINTIEKDVSDPLSHITDFGIGPMEFYCPAPLPAPNEEGLIFVKQGTPEVLLCEEVDYSFRIINTNCDEKEMTFTDELPMGMIWVNNSVGTELESGSINGYGTRKLTIDNLKVPGGGATHVIRAKAIFEQNATAGAYTNRANIVYTNRITGATESLYSTDRLTGEEETITNALNSDRPEQIIATIETDKSCYNVNGEIEVKVILSNPNGDIINSAYLNLDFDVDIFKLKYGKDKNYGIETNIPGLLDKLIDDVNDPDYEPINETGSIEFEGFTLKNDQEYWITYTVKSSDNEADYNNIDPNTFAPEDVSFGFDFFIDSDDVCTASSAANASGTIDLSFCTFCTELPTGGKPTPSNVGISAFKDQIEGWPQNVANGYLVLESGKKGMILSRTTPEAIGEANWKEGMIIYNTDLKCINIYDGTEWKCIQRSCNKN